MILEFTASGGNLDEIDADIKRKADQACSGRLWSVAARGVVEPENYYEDGGIGEPMRQVVTRWSQFVRVVVEDA